MKNDSVSDATTSTPAPGSAMTRETADAVIAAVVESAGREHFTLAWSGIETTLDARFTAYLAGWIKPAAYSPDGTLIETWAPTSEGAKTWVAWMLRQRDEAYAEHDERIYQRVHFGAAGREPACATPRDMVTGWTYVTSDVSCPDCSRALRG